MSENVWQAVNAVQAALGPQIKGGTMTGGGNYTYLKVEDLVQAIRPLMVAEGLLLVPIKHTDVQHEPYAVRSGAEWHRVRTVVTWHVHHGPSDTGFNISTLGEGADSGDKSTNKAQTGAYKYALMELFMVEQGDDDPDRQGSHEQEGVRPTRPTAPQTRPAPAQAVSTGGAPEEPPPIGDEGYGDTNVFTPVGPQTTAAQPDLTGQNRWGDETWGCFCPAHGEGDVKVQKRDGSPYLSRDGNPIGHCNVVVNEGADKPWDKFCWGELLIPTT